MEHAPVLPFNRRKEERNKSHLTPYVKAFVYAVVPCQPLNGSAEFC